MDCIPGYNITHNTHQKMIIENIANFRESGTLVDCTLEVEGNYLNAHKVILSACSLGFSDLFRQHQNETTFILTGLSFNDLEILIDFMYKGEIVIPQDNLEKFLNIAKDLRIKGLFENKSSNLKNSNDERNLEIKQNNNSQVENVSKLGTTDKVSSTIPEKSLFYSSKSKDISSREDSQSPVLKKRKIIKEGICESDCINAIQQDQLVPVLKVPEVSVGTIHVVKNLTHPESESLKIITEENEDDFRLVYREGSESPDLEEQIKDVATHTTKNTIQPNFGNLDVTKDNVDDCSVKNDCSESNDVIFKNSSDRDHSPSSVSKNREIGRICDIDSTDVTQEKQITQGLEVTNNSGDTSHKTEKLSQEIPPSIEEINRWYCPQCGNMYTTKRSLTIHVKYECGTGPRFQCDICHKKFKFLVNLEAHKIIHDPERETYSCPQCGRDFLKKYWLNKHIMDNCGK